ncbi:zinc finger BED domain-containing protein 1-like [Rhizophagus clarus]|uniref:Zinc finger BED domain-containing protein 1-like n=1 Tax=Rhizophagus clarus TaxID=94130 RepID=A0A8H3LRV1_9GLOM|nr:zinc finger BED domain-containing protein 1-like [Rhizophagus clarus]
MKNELTEMTVNQQLTLDKETDLTLESYTATFLAEKINEVITDVGPEKFSAVVSDHATACASTKQIIANIHKHIIPIRCIMHHINLIITDICKTLFTKEVILKCMKLLKVKISNPMSRRDGQQFVIV